MYSIKNQQELDNQFKRRLYKVLPIPDSTFLQLLDSITYKGIFRKELKIYCCEFHTHLENLPSVQKVEDKLFRFFLETQKIDLNSYLVIDTARFEQSNYSIYKMSHWLK